MFLQIALCGAVQFGALYFLKKQPWFKPIVPGKEETITCWENTVIFLVSSYQYIILALVYSKGKPFRQSVFTNTFLIFCSFILMIFLTFLLLYPIKIVAKFFEIIPWDHDHVLHIFRYELLGFPVAHFLLSILIEVSVCFDLLSIVICSI